MSVKENKKPAKQKQPSAAFVNFLEMKYRDLGLLGFALFAALAHLCYADEDEEYWPNDIISRPSQDIEIRQKSRDADED